MTTMSAAPEGSIAIATEPAPRIAAVAREPQASGVDEMQVAIAASSLGLVLVARSEKGIAAVLLGDDRDVLYRDFERRFPGAESREADATLAALAAEVVRCVESPAHELDAPLDLRGTEFQRRVWRALREIPAGSTATYADIAIRIGLPKSARAVAQACGANAIAVLVPCHRIVRSDGDLAGYRWGVERKRALLAREAAVARAHAGNVSVAPVSS